VAGRLVSSPQSPVRAKRIGDSFNAEGRRRQNELVLAGWTILRFTWDDLTHRPTTVLAALEA